MEATFILLLVSFFLSPATAIVAKYWMTRLVFTVFPAPDSPLKTTKVQGRSVIQFLNTLTFVTGNLANNTYVIRID